MSEVDLDQDFPEPRANEALQGHEAAENHLRGALDSGRLHHAWLISGPKGIGKATLAYRFARYVLTYGHDGGGGDTGLFAAADLAPAGPDEGLFVAPENPVFKRIVAGGHTDLLVIERTENDRGKMRTEIVVDDVRKSQNFFHMTAGEGGWRVIVVDAADEMNTNAANALLKMLEEPPPNALLLLVCHNPGRLLPTIRSRCQKLRLEALAVETVVSLMSRYAPDMPADDARVVAALAEGSIGSALDLINAGGLSVYGEVMALLDGLPRIDVPALHKFATSCGGQKGGPTFEAASELIRWTLARLIRHVGGGATQLAASEAQLFQRIGPALSVDRWLDVWDKVDHLLSSADHRNLDRKQVILNAFSTMEQAVRS